MKRSAWLFYVLFCLFATAAFGYEVTERYRLGASVEGMAFVTVGPLAGKVATVDGWNVYTIDPATGNYQKAFSVAGMGFIANPGGIASISQGEFAGNFLFSDKSDPDTLYMVSQSGTLAGSVQASGFQWKQPEGLTQVSSGQYQGCMALVHRGTSPLNNSNHIYILKLERNGGNIQAVLMKDLLIAFNDDILGITFLPADFPVPAYRGMFAVTARVGDDWTLQVIDTQGVRQATNPCLAMPEGLAYIPIGVFAGRLLISERYLLQAVYRSLDGLASTPAAIPPVGLGIRSPLNFTWLTHSQQFYLVSWDGRYYDLPGYLIARLGPDVWRIDSQFQLTHFAYARNLTDLTADGTYKLFGRFSSISPARYGVDRLDTSFQLMGTTPLPEGFTGLNFPSLVYVPGDTSDGDRFMAPLNKTIYSFDPLFSYPATVINISGSMTNNITGLCYDAAIRRFYVLDRTVLRVFDANWSALDSFNLLDAAPVVPSAFAKITSGELRGNIALLYSVDNELIMLNFEILIADDLLSRLIAEVRAANLEKGLTNSLVQKLENAKRSLEKKNFIPAINQVEAFINESQAQSGKDISPARADAWKSLAGEVVRGLQQLI